jgi:hypothetical protein
MPLLSETVLAETALVLAHVLILAATARLCTSVM